MKKLINTNDMTLRQRAEELHKKKRSVSASKLSEFDTLKLIHELEVHQIELEMQNEEVMLSRNQAELATEKYAELYDFATSGYFTLSEKGNIIDLNLSGSEMLGKERSHLKNRSFSFFVSNDTRPIFNHFLGKVFKSKIKETCEVNFSNNGSLPMNAHLTGIVTKNGEQCLVTVIDITNRKRVEETLKKLSNAVEQTADIVFITNRDGIIEYVNPAFEKLTGYTKQEVVGKTPRILKSGSYSQAQYEQIWKTILSGITFKNVILNKRKSGELFYTEQTITPVKDTQGNITHFVSTNRDITERKQAEELLRESEVKYQEIFESTGTATFIIEEDTTILMANNECYSITGYTPTEIIGQKWNQYFAPESLQEVMKNHQLRRQNPDLVPKKYEVKIVNKQGEKRDVILNVSMISGTKQRIVSMSDITELKRMEDALRKSEENLSKMIANIGYVIVIIDQNGINRYKSPNIEKWFGWSPEEVIGVSIWENVHPEDVDSLKILFGTLVEKPNANETTEIRYRCKDGSFKWIEFTVVNLLDDPDIRGLLGNYHDITERKHTDETLRLSEERYRFSLEITGQIGWSIPPDGLVEDMPLWRQYTGQSIEEVKGWKWLDSIHPDDREHTKKIWFSATDQKCKYDTE